MKLRRWIVGVLLASTALAGAVPFYVECGQRVISMKLVNIKTGFVVVEFEEGKAYFGDPFLREQMKDRGIFIPPSYREAFAGKEYIKLDEPEFQTAFEKIYYLFTIDNSVYQWR
jgi:hypothetical protein